MVYDKIDNIEYYRGLSDDIYEGLKFLKLSTPRLVNGVHEINSSVKAIVSGYETKPVNENGYESHRKYIDIQYLLEGVEKNYCSPIEKLHETKSYDEEADIAFFSAELPTQELVLSDGYFAIYYPQDGHMPGVCIKESQYVRKIVIKVKV